MNEHPTEDWLDARLREEMPYIDDAGFTARVVRQLPVRRQKRSLRAVILIGMSIVAALIAYVGSGDGRVVVEGIWRLASMPISTLMVMALACGILVTVGCTAAALSKNTDRLS